MQGGAADAMQMADNGETFYGPLGVLVVLVVAVALIVFAVKWIGARRERKAPSQEN